MDLKTTDVLDLIKLSLREDAFDRDVTTEACSITRNVKATIIAKKPAIACGSQIADLVLEAAGMNDRVKSFKLAQDGSLLKENTPWIILEGPGADVLRIERTILNFLIRMCGIATRTRAVVDAVAGTSCKVLHTRKTAPGHRATDIYAALTGGAHPHRRSLSDAILVKENHWHAAASFQDITAGINKLRSQVSFVEIEVRDLIELKHAIAAKPDRIMLDNFSFENIRKAVMLFGSACEFEASGNITLENAREYADTDVEYISLGSITHSAPAADLSMFFDWNK